MKHLLGSRITVVWLLLVAATAVSWEMGHGAGFRDLRLASASIIVIAFIKVRFVILDFMEIRNAPLPMRLIGELWVVVICTTLVTLYWRAPH